MWQSLVNAPVQDSGKVGRLQGRPHAVAVWPQYAEYISAVKPLSSVTAPHRVIETFFRMIGVMLDSVIESQDRAQGDRVIGAWC